jgi:hypothetical protein
LRDPDKKLAILALGIAIVAVPILLAYYILHVLTVLLLFVFIIPGFLFKRREYLKYFLLGLLVGGIASVLFFIYVAVHLGL